MRKPEGGRSERDFASAMGATATQKRSLRNARPRVAAVRAVAMSTAAVRAAAVKAAPSALLKRWQEKRSQEQRWRKLRQESRIAEAGFCHIKASKLGKERGKIRERLSHTALIVYNDLRRSGKRSKL